MNCGGVHMSVAIGCVECICLPLSIVLLCAHGCVTIGCVESSKYCLINKELDCGCMHMGVAIGCVECICLPLSIVLLIMSLCAHGCATIRSLTLWLCT